MHRDGQRQPDDIIHLWKLPEGHILSEKGIFTVIGNFQEFIHL